jgi:hypothetical protein
MFVPFQSVSMRRCRGRPLGLAIPLTLVLGLTGLSVQGPPLQPPGDIPGRSGQPKKCPGCDQAVRPDRHMHYTCLICGMEFIAAEAEDYV